ncbi:hypothetical protein [Runella sp.]|uniref:hypothetical protein n=1 Tax=Runella sp. TaxID=1960881 RepID=UPI003D0D2E61
MVEALISFTPFEEHPTQYKIHYKAALKDDYSSLATRISNSILYPITVPALMDIFETDTYFREYCNEAFSGEEWESIVIDENDQEDAPLFFIRLSEN